MRQISMCMNEQNIVLDLADKLQDPDYIRAVSTDASHKNPAIPDNSPWEDLSLAHGYPSLVLFYNKLHQIFPNQQWDYVTHEYIKKIVESVEKKGIANFSLFVGLSGVCYAIMQASQNGTRYQKLLQQLNEVLIRSVERTYFAVLQEEIGKGIASSPSHCDLIQGIIGIGVYFITQSDNPLFYSPLKILLELVIKRTEPIRIDGQEVPGWYIPNGLQFIDQDKQNYPNGNFNLGIAHGVPGTLAFLSEALMKGIELPGQRTSVLRIVRWLKAKAILRDGQFIWPERVSWEAEIHQVQDACFMQRMGWCYGKPGILRSLFLAGAALKDFALQEYCRIEFKKIFTLSEEEWYLPGPMFCHGLSGLYMITRNMAADTKDATLGEEALKLKQKILNFYHPGLPFGFQDFEPANVNREERSIEHLPTNKVGLLDGSVGIALALLDSFADSKNRCDAPFLISSL